MFQKLKKKTHFIWNHFEPRVQVSELVPYILEISSKAVRGSDHMMILGSYYLSQGFNVGHDSTFNNL